MVERNPKWLVLISFENSHSEITCHLQVQMVRLRNQTLKQKILVPSCSTWEHVREWCWIACFIRKVGKTPEPVYPSWPQPWTFLAFTSPTASHFSCDIKGESLLTGGHHCSFTKPPCRMYRTSGIKEVLSFNHCSVFCRDKWVGPSCPNRLS